MAYDSGSSRPPPGTRPPPGPLPGPVEAIGASSGPTTIALFGELDLSSVARLEHALRRLDQTPGRVDVDLGAVTFADSHGIQPLLDAVQRRREGGFPALRLVDVSPAVRWVLDLLG